MVESQKAVVERKVVAWARRGSLPCIITRPRPFVAGSSSLGALRVSEFADILRGQFGRCARSRCRNPFGDVCQTATLQLCRLCTFGTPCLAGAEDLVHKHGKTWLRDPPPHLRGPSQRPKASKEASRVAHLPLRDGRESWGEGSCGSPSASGSPR